MHAMVWKVSDVVFTLIVVAPLGAGLSVLLYSAWKGDR